MHNTDDSTSDKEQLINMPIHYGTLLAMTRPLVITEYTLLSLRGGEVSRSGCGISPELADWCEEFTLRTGEFVRPGLSEPGMRGDEGLATKREGAGISSDPEGECDLAGESIFALSQTVSNLKLRIHLGMS